MDEFLRFARAGDEPSIEDYANAHPELADEIRDVFPAVLMVENIGVPGSDSNREQPVPAVAEQPERLGEYKILREIGRGGMGIVYEAIQESLRRHVAVKVLPFSAVMLPDQVTRFQREARAAARLHHGHIVPVFGVGHDQGVHYYVMQYINGRPLDAVIREIRQLRGTERNNPTTENDGQSAIKTESSKTRPSLPDADHLGARADSTPERDPQLAVTEAQTGGQEKVLLPLTNDRGSADSSDAGMIRSDLTSSSGNRSRYFRSVARIGIQASEGLEHAHREGLLHRDIKPSNLLIDLKGDVWITDFGLAKSSGEDLTQTGDLVGTMRYMPPERIRGWSDPRSDVYSLGLTLYELLVLQPAFVANERIELIKAIETQSPVAPHRIDSAIPRDLETIVLKSIEKEPSDRYQTALDLANDLRRFLDGKPIVAKRSTSARRTWLWCRRNPVLAAAFGFVLMLMIAITILSLEFSRQTQNRIVEVNAARELSDARRCDLLLAQIEFSRRTKAPGSRKEAMEAIAEASQLLSGNTGEASQQLRNLAIAVMSMIDLNIVERWESDLKATYLYHPCFDAGLNWMPRINEQNEVEIVDLETGIAKSTELFSDRAYTNLAISPDGTMLAILGSLKDYKSIRIFDIRERKVVFEKEVPELHSHGIYPVEFSFDGRLFGYQAGESRQVLIRSTADGSIYRELPATRMSHLDFSPVSNHLLVCNMEEVVIWDLETGEKESVIRPSARAFGVAFGPKGQSVGGVTGRGVEFWQLDDDGKVTSAVYQSQTSNPGTGDEFAFHPHLPYAVTYGRDGQTRLWNSYSATEEMKIELRCGTFSSDGLSIGFVHQDGGFGKVRFIAPAECRKFQVPHADRAITSVSFSDNEELLLTASEESRREFVWDLKTSELVAIHARDVSEHYENFCPSFCPGTDNLIFGAGRDSFDVRQLVTEPSRFGGVTRHWGPAKILGDRARSLYATGFSSDGNQIAIHAEAEIVLVNWRTQETRHAIDLSDKYRLVETDHLSISPDNRFLATSGVQQEMAWVFDLETEEVVFQWKGSEREDGQINGGALAEFSRCGKMVALSGRNEFQIYSTEDWSLLKSLPRETRGLGYSSFSDDYLAVADGDFVGLYSLDGFQLLARLQTAIPGLVSSHDSEQVPMMRFSPSGQYLAVGTIGNEIQLWDLPLVRKRLAENGIDWTDRK